VFMTREQAPNVPRNPMPSLAHSRDFNSFYKHWRYQRGVFPNTDPLVTYFRCPIYSLVIGGRTAALATSCPLSCGPFSIKIDQSGSSRCILPHERALLRSVEGSSYLPTPRIPPLSFRIHYTIGRGLPLFTLLFRTFDFSGTHETFEPRLIQLLNADSISRETFLITCSELRSVFKLFLFIFFLTIWGAFEIDVQHGVSG